MRKKVFHPRHLDIEAFCRAGEALSGQNMLGEFERLQQPQDEIETRGAVPVATATVNWSVTGEWQTGTSQAGAWLHLEARASVPRTCQRCLQPMAVDLHVDRSFRFVETETLAAELDEVSDDDVLVTSRNFNLLELIEDELLLDLPIVPMHVSCDGIQTTHEPRAVETDSSEPAAARTDRPNPFSLLQSIAGSLRKDDPDSLS